MNETSTNGVERDESVSLGKLAEALAKAQSGMSGASKDGMNPHFKSRYSSLASVWEACREVLASNGLAVLQPVTSTGDGVIVSTQLVHSSGEWIRARLYLPVAQKTAQGYGSAISYGRRYGLASMVGVVSEDDDGEVASKAVDRSPKDKPETQAKTGAVKEKLKANAAQKPIEEMTDPELTAALGRAQAALSDEAKKEYWPAARERVQTIESEQIARREKD